MRAASALVLLAVFSLSAVAPLAAQGTSRLLVAFNKTKPGYYDGSWTSDTVTRSKQGLFVAGDANGAGKIGESGLAWDLSKDAYLELAVAVGPANEMGGFGFVLVDADGTEIRWALPLADLQPGAPKTLKLEFAYAINTAKTGDTPGFDRGKVAVWRAEGDGVSTTPAQLVFIVLNAGR